MILHEYISYPIETLINLHPTMPAVHITQQNIISKTNYLPKNAVVESCKIDSIMAIQFFNFTVVIFLTMHKPYENIITPTRAF